MSFFRSKLLPAAILLVFSLALFAVSARIWLATTVSVPAKDVLYPMGGSLEEKAETAKMYQKTHGNFGPGE